MAEVNETQKHSSEIAKESWSKPEFEIIGVELTEHKSTVGNDGSGTFSGS